MSQMRRRGYLALTFYIQNHAATNAAPDHYMAGQGALSILFFREVNGNQRFTNVSRRHEESAPSLRGSWSPSDPHQNRAL